MLLDLIIILPRRVAIILARPYHQLTVALATWATSEPWVHLPITMANVGLGPWLRTGIHIGDLFMVVPTDHPILRKAPALGAHKILDKAMFHTPSCSWWIWGLRSWLKNLRSPLVIFRRTAMVNSETTWYPVAHLSSCHWYEPWVTHPGSVDLSGFS